MRFVNSLGLGDPPSFDPIRRRLERHPGLRFKVDASPQWTPEMIDELAATDAVEIVDFKGHYGLEFGELPALLTMYERVIAAFPDALLEDAHDLPEVARAARARGAPHLLRRADPLGRGPRRDPVPPARGQHQAVPRRRPAVAARRLRRVRGARLVTYGGGMGELDVGRGQIQLLASLFHPDGPNDVAPDRLQRRHAGGRPTAEPAARPRRPRPASGADTRIPAMAVVRLRGPLKRLAGDRSEHAIEGGSVGELLVAIERAHPAAQGWILDERGVLRRHINVFVNGEPGAAGHAGRRRRPDRRAAGDLGRMRAVTELLVGTKKGLFVLEGEPGSRFEVAGRAFAGEPVEYALHDPRSGRVLASVTSPFYGPKIWYSDGRQGDWEQAGGVALPEGANAALERIWVLVPGEEERHAVRRRRPRRAVREPRRRRDVRAQPGALEASEPRRGGSRAPAACACTRSPPGRASRTGWPSPSPRPACG